MLDVETLATATLLDAEEEELGPVAEVFTSASDDTPAWVVVELDDRRVAIPLDGAEADEDEVRVRFGRELIAGAPDFDGDVLMPEDEVALYEHYGIADADPLAGGDDAGAALP